MKMTKTSNRQIGNDNPEEVLHVPHRHPRIGYRREGQHCNERNCKLSFRYLFSI